MNKQQTEYLLKNYKTQSEEELAGNLQVNRKDLRRELRRILAAPKKDGSEFDDLKNVQPGFSSVASGLEGWLAGKDLYVLFSLIFLNPSRNFSKGI